MKEGGIGERKALVSTNLITGEVVSYGILSTAGNRNRKKKKKGGGKWVGNDTYREKGGKMGND